MILICFSLVCVTSGILNVYRQSSLSHPGPGRLVPRDVPVLALASRSGLFTSAVRTAFRSVADTFGMKNNLLLTEGTRAQVFIQS